MRASGAKAWAAWRESFAFGVLALLVYLAPGAPLPGNDVRPIMFVPHAVLMHGDTSFAPADYPFMFRWTTEGKPGTLRISSTAQLRELASTHKLVLRAPKYYVVPTSDPGHFASTFGSLPGLLALPAVSLVALFDADFALSNRGLGLTAWWVAALLCACAVALTHRTSRLLGHDLLATRLTTLSFAFGTAVFSLSSQALWQQTAALFFLSVAMHFAARIARDGTGALRCGVALVLASWARPTALIAASCIVGWLALRRQPGLWRLALPVALGAATLLLHNTMTFGSPFVSEQSLASKSVALSRTGSTGLFQTPPWLGAAGLLLSPSRGLLVYSPVLAFAVAAFRKAQGETRGLLTALCIALATMWLVAFSWFDWWGGFCYAYRPLVDSLPLLTPLLGAGLCSVRLRSLRGVGLCGSLAWSIALHTLGAFAYEPLGWNAKDGQSVDAPEHRGRLWSWSEAPFVHYARTFTASRADRQRLARMWLDDPRL